MKRHLFFLLVFFTTCNFHSYAEQLSEKYYKLAKSTNINEMKKELSPIAIYSDGVVLMDMSYRIFNWQLTTRDVIIYNPNEGLFFGFVNIVKKDKEKEALQITSKFRSLCGDVYSRLIDQGAYPNDIDDCINKTTWRGDSTKIINTPFPYEIVFGIKIDSLKEKSYVYPQGAIKNESKTRALLCGQWGKDNFQQKEVLGVDIEHTWLTNSGNYNWTFGEDGTGNVSWKAEWENLCPQKAVASWRGQYNKERYQLTGGYYINLTSTITLSFSWRLKDDILYISYKSFAFTPISGKPILPKRSEYATQQCYNDICAQIKQDYPTNDDVKKYKAEMANLLTKEKASFTPSEVPFTLQVIDGTLLIASNPYADMITLTRNQPKNARKITKENFDEVISLESGLEEYSEMCNAYINCIKAYVALEKKEEEKRKQLELEAQKKQKERENIIPRFIQELKRPSSDKSIGFWGASVVLAVDYDQNNWEYNKLLSSTKIAEDWMRNDVSVFLPFVDWRVRKISNDEYIVFFLKGKSAKKQKLYSTHVYLTADDKIDCTKSFKSLTELKDIKWADLP